MKNNLFKILLASVLLCATVFCTTGCSILVSSEQTTSSPSYSIEDLSDGQYYVWHDDNADNMDEVIKGEKYKDPIFLPVFLHGYTFKGNEVEEGLGGNVSRIIWCLDEEEDKIPTYYEGDNLIYYSTQAIPKKFVFERFTDEGYTFGIAGITVDASGKLNYSFGSDLIFPESDMNRISSLSKTAESITIASISDVALTENYIDKAGILHNAGTDEEIKSLEKDGTYNFDFYAGTILYPASIKADTRAFVSMEDITTYDYDLIGSTIAIVNLPDYLKTGYYMINGNGLFRYIAEGNSYDDATDFNDPMLIRDEKGSITYDPSIDTEIETETGTGSTESIGSTEASTDSSSSVIDSEDAIEFTVPISAADTEHIFAVTYEKKEDAKVYGSSVPQMSIISPSGVEYVGKASNGIIKYSISAPETGDWIIKVYGGKNFNIKLAQESDLQ